LMANFLLIVVNVLDMMNMIFVYLVREKLEIIKMQIPVYLVLLIK